MRTIQSLWGATYQVIAVAAARRRHSGLESLTPTAVVGVVKECNPAGGGLLQLACGTQGSEGSEEDDMYGLHSCCLRCNKGVPEAEEKKRIKKIAQSYVTTSRAGQLDPLTSIPTASAFAGSFAEPSPPQRGAGSIQILPFTIRYPGFFGADIVTMQQFMWQLDIVMDCFDYLDAASSSNQPLGGWSDVTLPSFLPSPFIRKVYVGQMESHVEPELNHNIPLQLSLTVQKRQM